MTEYKIRVHPSARTPPREHQLAWHIAAFAGADAPVDDAAAAMAKCRIADNAAVALAAINRRPVVSARAQALAHRGNKGATLFGIDPDTRIDCEWAAWANATAVRELDFHDTFLAEEFGHPGDNIPPLIAVAQQCRRSGADLLRGILVAYEVHVALMKSINLHRYKKDHLAHLAPATVAGIGAMLRLPVAVIFQAVNQAVHLSFSTRQSRKGEISSWKAYVPAFSGKLAVEAVDRAMRGETSPAPIYEGEDSVIAWMLAGPDAEYTVDLPDEGEPARAILETYTKAHSAEYQAQAIIDLAFEVRERIELAQVKEIILHTSGHTHEVIGSGANDPQKQDPDASRETLDHSISYILAVALEDGDWHHESSYHRERAHRPETISLWRKIRTVADPEWERLYHEPDPGKRAFGGRLEIVMQDGHVVEAGKAVADAHPNGRAPWTWPDYVGKFDRLTDGRIEAAERARFLALVEGLDSADPDELLHLNPALPGGRVDEGKYRPGIFEHT
ncbi:MAG: MmgE/PrpD family protein [Gammaproteobacteria bacterium]|nr:MmgE/PrpD family protein [Gammaproteobacteria bacterium]